MDVLSELAARSLPLNGHKWTHRVCLFDALFPDMAIMPPTPAADTKPDTPAASAEPSGERKPQDAELDIKSVWGSPKKKRAAEGMPAGKEQHSKGQPGKAWARVDTSWVCSDRKIVEGKSHHGRLWVLLGEGGQFRPEVQGRRLQWADLAGDAD